MSTTAFTQRIINPSPKTRFQQSTDSISKHRAMVDTREFSRAADFAMLQYQRELSIKESNPAVLGMKLVGAQEFLNTMTMLAETIELKPLPKTSDNLQAQ